MNLIVAHSSQCRDGTTNLESHKTLQNMRLEFCHGAVPLLWRRREWIAALELLPLPWRKKSSGRPPTTSNVETKRMVVSARAPPASMGQKKQRQAAQTSQCRDTTANLESHKTQQSMRLECCHGAVPLLWLV